MPNTDVRLVDTGVNSPEIPQGLAHTGGQFAGMGAGGRRCVACVHPLMAARTAQRQVGHPGGARLRGRIFGAADIRFGRRHPLMIGQQAFQGLMIVLGLGHTACRNHGRGEAESQNNDDMTDGKPASLNH